jgi:hypothetical protein
MVSSFLIVTSIALAWQKKCPQSSKTALVSSDEPMQMMQSSRTSSAFA